MGHNLMLLAGLAQLLFSPVLLSQLPGIPRAAPPLMETAAVEPGPSRWSGDGWLLLRQDSASSLSPGQPSYGRSQVGAVLRYRLGAATEHRPQAHLRASSALAGPREHELATGLSARPLPRVALRAVVEARVSETASGTEVRPAGYVVTSWHRSICRSVHAPKLMLR